LANEYKYPYMGIERKENYTCSSFAKIRIRVSFSYFNSSNAPPIESMFPIIE
jgi:hypothetical protein